MKKKVVWRLISFVLVIVVLFAGYNVYSMFSFFHTVGANKPFSTGTQPLNTAKWEGKGVVNILFMGVDRRGTDERPRSDTMLLASINPDTKQVSIFSIMRDTYVDIPGYGKGKINAAFADGGPELLIDTIQSFLKIPIHYYMATDFEGFSKIIDAIGGIDVDVPEDFVHADDGVYDIHLKKVNSTSMGSRLCNMSASEAHRALTSTAPNVNVRSRSSSRRKSNHQACW